MDSRTRHSRMPFGDEGTCPTGNAISPLDSPLGVIDADGHIVFCNHSFAGLFGPADRGAALRERLSHGPYQIVAKGGRVFSMQATTLPAGWLVVGRDASAPTYPAENESTQIDAVTQLGDREELRKRLTALLAGPAAAIEPGAVLLVNLERFKLVNSSLGQAVGDKLLRLVADRLRSVLSERGFAARLGGDEFAIVEPGRQAQSAADLAERLNDLLGRSYLIDGHLLNIGINVGVALFPAHGTTFDSIMKSASLALHNAKMAGAGKYQFFSGVMEAAALARRSLEVDLRRALALRELMLVYHPQYNIAAQRITGFEALLRWHHPQRGLVSPAEFIPLAEEIGLIVPIGEWVIKTACHAAALWPEPLSIAVNVSPVQFRSPDLAAAILSSLDESGLETKRLELEITESTLLNDQKAALDLLHAMRGLGVRVAMDDFGTGYSSLSFLRSFPFDKIKIDQSFIRTKTEDPTDNAIVHAIATLGQSLGATTVAEGVETPRQLERVALADCTDIQGYLISKPITVDKIPDLLRESAIVSKTAAALA
jgi:diguanylate cyclase (GGDEF)-like protein